MPYVIDTVAQQNKASSMTLSPQFGGFLGGLIDNPFYSNATAVTPTEIKGMFHWCRWAFNCNSLIGSIISKLAMYPVTEIQILPPDDDEETEDKVMEERIRAWDKIINKQMKLKSALVEVGLDYHTFGSSFVTPIFPKENTYTCKRCGTTIDINAKKLRYQVDSEAKRIIFSGDCDACMGDEEMELKEINLKTGIPRLHRFSPENIDITYNSTRGSRVYYYNIPNYEKNIIRLRNDPEYYRENDKIFIEGALSNNPVKLRAEKMYHFMAPGVATTQGAWPLPPLMRVLRDLYQMEILRKSQEQIATEHAVPVRFVFPQPTSVANPAEMISLSKWQADTMEALFLGKRDKNLIQFSKLPVGVANVGGDAKGLFITPELEYIKMVIINGFMCPREFIEGGLSFSGSSMSLRMLENMFINYREMMEQFLFWLKEIIREHTGLGDVQLKFKRLKMADDVQKTQMALQLWREKLLSGRTFLNDQEYDWDSEQMSIDMEVKSFNKRNMDQAVASAEAQAEGGVIMAKSQVRSQYEVQKLQESFADKARDEAADVSRRQWFDYLVTLEPDQLIEVAGEGKISMADLVSLHIKGMTTDSIFMQISSMIKEMSIEVLSQFGIDPIKLTGLPKDLARQYTNGMLSPEGLLGTLQAMMQQQAAEQAAAQGGAPPKEGGDQQQGGGAPQQQDPASDPNARAQAYSKEIGSAKNAQEAEMIKGKIKSTDPEAYKILSSQPTDNRAQPEQRPPTRKT